MPLERRLPRRLKALQETEINYGAERGAYLIRAINAVL